MVRCSVHQDVDPLITGPHILTGKAIPAHRV